MTTKRGEFVSRLIADHRQLDNAFGRYLAAVEAAVWDPAAEALAVFDDMFRRHAGIEEEAVFSRMHDPSDPQPGEIRELALEHTQIRELCSISRIKLRDGLFDDARSLSVNLARRFAQHEEREENHFYGLASRELSDADIGHALRALEEEAKSPLPAEPEPQA
jgi:hemerythrin-like domain-containing protein